MEAAKESKKSKEAEVTFNFPSNIDEVEPINFGKCCSKANL